MESPCHVIRLALLFHPYLSSDPFGIKTVQSADTLSKALYSTVPLPELSHLR
ncbi:hypothetical protein Barb6_03063 [Bacteroidales bacterium Barb6]|nr:hypothetical protein Barb6_03063 [Bacteroidales bacterium Barb6]